MNLIDFFTDPILRAPTIGSMLLCIASGLIGVLAFLRKRSLLGEALSHASYPGVTMMILLAGIFAWDDELFYLIPIGAFVSAMLGFWVIDRMENKLRTSPDASLTAVLALFFGLGVTIASFAQTSYSHLYRQMQAYLFGQAATMIDIHIVFYSALLVLVVAFITVFYKELLTLSFDGQFAKTAGISHRYLEPTLFVMIVINLVMGIRCAGVILTSAMLIAPAIAARQFTNHLSRMFTIAACFGALSGFLGVYGSVVFAVPTGPMIVLVSGGIAVYALLLAPKRGLLIRFFRIVRFRNVCIRENILKTIWRLSQEGKGPVSLSEISQPMGFPSLHLRMIMYRLIKQRCIRKAGSEYFLTPHGAKKGARIVRLHRLWEAYLVYCLGLKVERVHKSAEEMEHILTPDLEKQLIELLKNPLQDPHCQPIPAAGEA